MLHLLACLGLAAGLVTAPDDSTELRRTDLMTALQGGGYTILLRHARTDRSVKEDPGSIPAERSGQRNLSEDGIADAKLMGLVLRKYHIPIGQILSSPLYRTRETAELAAGTPTNDLLLRIFPSTAEQAALVAAAPPAGTNRLLVTHHFVIETHVPGIRPGDVGESEAAVVRPTGDGHVELIGRITLSDWQTLAGVAVTAPATSAGTTYEGATRHAPAGATVAIPDTPAGRIARRYVEAFNSGDGARLRSFVETSLVPDPTRSTETRQQALTKLWEEFGPLSIDAVHGAESSELILGAQTKKGAVRLTIRTSADQPGRAASISFAHGVGGHS